MSMPQVGLGLLNAYALNIATAPAERINLLLQTQDEIILNLREESQLAYTHQKSRRHQIKSDATLTQPAEEQDIINYDDDDDFDQEPRSIIVPHAQLPYTNIRDCAERLVEKEGALSLWRGYYLEYARLFLQSRIESSLYRVGFPSLFSIRRLSSSPTPLDTFLGSATWILSVSIEGTAVSTVALLAVYPLAYLHSKMAVDVIRRTRTIKKTQSVEPVSTVPDIQDSTSHLEDDSNHSSSGEMVESIEWVDHSEDSQAGQEGSVGSTKDETTLTTKQSASSSFSASVQEYVYELSYKYKCAREIVKETLESSEGFLGFYKGFSTVLASTFISRIGYMVLYRTLSPILIRSYSPRGVGTFILILGTTGLVNLAVYPLSTIWHRRMIARPGRYLSSVDAGKQIVEKYGWRSLYQGVEVSMIRSAATAVLFRLFV